MRFWLLLNDEPAGPFTGEALEEVPGFSRASLVYPERRLDPRDERWMRAGDVPQLAPALSALERKAFAGRYLVPEPTVRDLPLLGAILKQLERFEEELVELRGNLIARHQELTALRGDSESTQTQTDSLEIEFRKAEAEIAGRIEKLEPLQADILRLREAGMETAQAARQAQERVLQEVENVRKRLESLEGDVDRDAQNEMMRAYTASLQERLELTVKGLDAESKKSAALGKEVTALRERAERETAARGFFAGGPKFRKPEALLTLLLSILLGAVGFLFYERLRTPSTEPPVETPPVVSEPTPDPAPAPEPKPKIETPRPARARKSLKKRAEQKVRERKVRETILLRVTGGVPSSKRVVVPERKIAPLAAPEPSKN